MCLAWVVPVRAHFIWIIPGKSPDKNPVPEVIFSDSLNADSAELLKKIGETRFFAQTQDGKVAELKKKEAASTYLLALPPDGCRTIRGVCHYGVVQRGNSPPFLLIYYAKAILPSLAKKDSESSSDDETSEDTPLEIIPVKGKPGTFQVLWHQQPHPVAEVTVLRPGSDKGTQHPVDIDGMFAVEEGKAPAGTYGMRVNFVDTHPGKHDGKAYKEIRYYATLVVRY
jgi:hypothetical protein